MAPVDIYSKPLSSLRYSTEFFEHVTFAHASSMSYPLSRAYEQGSWCIVGTLVMDGSLRHVILHFIKVRLCILVNNNSEHITLAKDTFVCLSETGLMSHLLLERLGHTHIHAPIQGFKVTNFPLYKLGYLLWEQCLDEDLVNALCELSYFKSHPAITKSSALPHIILPTILSNNSQYLLATGSSDMFTKRALPWADSFKAIWDRISACSAAAIHMVSCSESHFSAQTYHPATGRLEHRDLLGQPPAPYILPTFMAILRGTGLPIPNEVAQVVVPMQLQAYGSCGIAALNFVETQLDPFALHWSDSASTYLWNTYLHNLVVFHLVASENVTPPSAWVEAMYLPVQATEAKDSDSAALELLYGHYNDYNSYAPGSNHPIFQFIQVDKTEPFQPVLHLPQRGDHPFYYFCTVSKGQDSDPPFSAIDICVKRPPIQELTPFAVRTDIKVGTTFWNVEEAKQAVYAAQEKLGFLWKVGQSNKGSDGTQEDHRNGKSIKTGCNAHVNINRLSPMLWNITLVDFKHNHDRELALGGQAPKKPTAIQKQVVTTYVSTPGTTFTRTQLSTILGRSTLPSPTGPCGSRTAAVRPCCHVKAVPEPCGLDMALVRLPCEGRARAVWLECSSGTALVQLPYKGRARAMQLECGCCTKAVQLPYKGYERAV
ncbi:hypothetical protein FA15DRAFT_657697 [Coprinopsis marcescibilis]|uniref:FAR1 domain-containing protein n=1 Tax=Coprinopsis marcescibilis TaxID=230819 RepID=A0A5C3KP31_COPMA|nr:hypothetical protein FA15DRAFT_657697 [Coprinopsis marcescibilis]